MHLHPPQIANDFQHETAHHCAGETPCSVFDELESLDEEDKSEERKVQGVADQRGVVVG